MEEQANQETKHTEEEFLNVQQVAELMAMSEKSIYNLCASRRINPQCGRKFGKHWRFKKSEVLAMNLLLN